MAIYHFSVQAISRGKGQSSVASASYRSGEKLTDERTGEIKFYKREVMPDSMILSPEHAPEWVQDRQRLWNEVEKIESNKNSRLAREINVALPVELSHGQQKELIKNFAKEQFVDKGMVADISIHRDDPKNPHAHIMLTIRPFEKDGEWLKQKSEKKYIKDKDGNFTYNKNGNKRSRKIDLIGWDKRELVQEWRKEWANHANESLKQAQVSARIDHRSHKERGLETLPTKHLGHVASAMEKKDKNTERGDYNREVEEYNEIVIDLAKYREEKQLLEKEKTKVEQFNTPVERTQLQSAEKFLKSEPTFEGIDKRLAQLDNFEAKNDRNYKLLEQKDQDFKEIKDHLFGISSSQNRIITNQTEVDSIGLFKGLSKQNRNTKARAEKEIQRYTSIVQDHERKLAPYQDKYKFKSANEFNTIYEDYHKERPALREQNNNQRGAIRRERDVLQKAKSALENRFIREVASKYPNNPEMNYMNYNIAQSIDALNKTHGKSLSIEEIQQMRDSFKEDFKQASKNISHSVGENDRLNKVESYLNGYNEANSVVKKYENNPIYQGKIEKGKLSKTDKKLYEEALSDRNRYGQLLKQHHVKDRDDLHEQKENIGQLMDKVPQFQQQADQSQKGAGLLDGIIQGIEQAQRQMEQQKQQTKSKTRTQRKQKYKQKEIGELEL